MPSQGVLAKLFKELVKKSKPLLRNEKDVDYLVEKGFNEALQNESVTGFNRSVYGEPSGLFYTQNARDIGNLIKGNPRGTGTIPPNMTAVPLPGSRSKVFTPEEWQSYMGKNRLEINKELKPKYDFISHPDLNTDQPKLYQTIQLNPNKAIAKIKTDKGSIYKILGLAGALGMGVDEMTNDAEAMPLGNIIKAGTKGSLKATQGPLSSTARTLSGRTLEGELLKGMQLENNVIRTVTKGNGQWRNIVFENGDTLPVTADYLNSIMRELGTQRYTAGLATKDLAGQQQQAINGLQNAFNYTYSNSRGLAETLRDKHNQKLTDILGPQHSDMVGIHFGGKYFYISKPYAELLSTMGPITLKDGTRGIVKLPKGVK